MADAESLPDALGSLPEIMKLAAGRRIAFFLDLDGTLAPIEARPDLVELPASSRRILEDLARRYPVAIVSGRGLDDLRDIVGTRSVFYVADHGFQILGTLRSDLRLEIGAEYRPQLAQAASQLRRTLATIEGAVVEEKGLSLSVHYRLVSEERRAAVLRAVADVAESFPVLRVTEGKLVYEFRPPGDWNKGKALVWLMEHLGMGLPEPDAVGANEPPSEGTAPHEAQPGQGPAPMSLDEPAAGGLVTGDPPTGGPATVDRQVEPGTRDTRTPGCPIALGDDLTDEDMFAAIQGWGISILVGDAARPTLAEYRLQDHLQAAEFLEKMMEALK